MFDQSYFFKLDLSFSTSVSPNKIGLAIIRTGANSFHSAILIVFNNQYFLMHLTGNFRILAENIQSLDAIYCVQWITNLEQSTIDFMILDFINIFNKYNRSIPYAPLYNPEHPYFTKDLIYIGKLGFSCSSFIFHTFSRREIKFLDIESWQISPQTLDWQINIINRLEQTPIEKRKTLNTEDYIAELKSELGVSPRISPDELSAAGYFYIQQSTTQHYDFVQSTLDSIHPIIDEICA